MRAKNILLIAVAVVIVMLPWPRGYSADFTGPAAPDFTLKSIDGSVVSLSSYKGKVILLNFWATWCSPCRDEMPSLNKLYLKYKDSGLVVLAVSTDDSSRVVERFMANNHVDFPVLLDSGMKISKHKYRVNAQPATFIISKDGKIINKYFGSVNWMDDTIQKEIVALL
ncbi:MAG: TlpA family protein disulfide reductase [Nitrospirae bacterium]|nr:TlpA family protein disulfide reductase [Nitrospirota bacterium]